MMACYFAKLNESNIVIKTIVVADNVPTADGDLSDNPCHADGETYCRNLYKNTNTWKQYFKDGSRRVRRAGLGYTYDAERDIFISPKPYPSWSLDDETTKWVAPVAHPDKTDATHGVTYLIDWDEDNRRWTGRKRRDNYSNWIWNASNTTWEAV